VFLLALLLLIALVVVFQSTKSSVPSQTASVRSSLLADKLGDVGMSGTGGSQDLPASAAPVDLPPASAPPAPAPADVAEAPPLQSHEVFAFAPYWTLGQSSGFDLQGLTTIAYFSVDVNPDGSLDQSSTGWQGFESQQLADLITRAHGAGDRVVLTVSDFDQGSLDQLTSSPTSPSTLADAIVQAVESKNLDGVNLDFEGEGSADQAGLTNLVQHVSDAMHHANPDYQVTMDTYASSAGDASGFYDIPALAPAVDGFFVMAYQLNLQASVSGAQSNLTRTMFPNAQSAGQYAGAVPPSKVILGLPFYGYDWPTTDGTLSAQASGGPQVVTSGQEMSSGHPDYWDPVTDTAWTSYQVGGQWHEAFYEDPHSLYLAARLAQSDGLGGVGIWALGFDDDNPSMIQALDGNAPADKGTLAGPTSTPPSATANSGAGPSSGAAPTPAAPVPAGSSGAGTTNQPVVGTGAPGTPASPSPPNAGSSTTTSTTAGSTSTPHPPSISSYTFNGTYNGATVTLAPGARRVFNSSAKPVGTLTGFTTDDPALSCLASVGGLAVWLPGPSAAKLVVVAIQPTDCATQFFTFPNPAAPQPTAGAG